MNIAPDNWTESWEGNNQRYLAAALNWLRLRLLRLVPAPASTPVATAPAADPAQQAQAGARWRFWERPAEDAAPPPLLLPPADFAVTDQQLAQAAEEMTAAENATPPPAMTMLSLSFGLSRFEREILLLCAALELDTRIASLCAAAQDHPQRSYPTFALALTLFNEPEWSALSPEGPLRHWRLLEINQPGAQPLTASALRADERIVNFLKGLNYLDDRLAPLLLPMAPLVPPLSTAAALLAPAPAALPPSHQRLADAILLRLRQTDRAQSLPVIQLVGPDAESKQLIAQRVAMTLGLRLYRLPAELMPAHAADLETLARLAERETALWPLAIYLDARRPDRETTSEPAAPPINRFLARGNGFVLLDVREARRELSRASAIFDIAAPTAAEQRKAWVAALGAEFDDAPTRLAAQFNFNLPTIWRIAAVVRQQTPPAPTPAEPTAESSPELAAASPQPAAAASSSEPAPATPASDEAAEKNEEAEAATRRHSRLWDECLAATRPELDGLAQRIEAKATWDDIVLPESELKLLRQIAAQVRHRGLVYEQWGFAASRSRGLSINALFAGESGTGKTMAAEVLANDLRLNLYRIDLSAVINKYIGETEKNLRRLFDAAENGGVILFFDEADALFGRRSEVKDSHDRYANIEINYLLQRLEAFTGLAIMATNMKSALDTAFLRRIRFIIEFRAHGQTERRAIWERVFPPETKTEGLDYDRLARLNLNGGSINNVAINAAFLAAQEGEAVTMPLVLAAARTELLKLKRPFSEADVQWRAPQEAVA